MNIFMNIQMNIEYMNIHKYSDEHSCRVFRNDGKDWKMWLVSLSPPCLDIWLFGLKDCIFLQEKEKIQTKKNCIKAQKCSFICWPCKLCLWQLVTGVSNTPSVGGNNKLDVFKVMRLFPGKGCYNIIFVICLLFWDLNKL